MNTELFDFDGCDLPEKQVVEGLCLSYDLLRCRCLETMEACRAEARQTQPHPQHDSR